MAASARCWQRTAPAVAPAASRSAKAWDAFAFRGARTRPARRATLRELLVLTSHLEVSLLEDGAAADLGAVVAEQEELLQARPSDDRPGEPDRTDELATQPWWVRLRVMRRYDEYERVLALVGSGGGGDPEAAGTHRPAELTPSR